VRASLAFLRGQAIDYLARVRPLDLRAFLAAEAERRPALGTQARTVAALKCFFRFLIDILERFNCCVAKGPCRADPVQDRPV